MELYSWNVNGYYACDRCGGFTEILLKSPDFICCQEVKISNAQSMMNLFTSEYSLHRNFSKNKGHNGVAIYSKIRPITYEVSIEYERFDAEGRFICLEFDNFFLINVYMPHGGRDKRDISYKLLSYRALKSYIENLVEKEKPIMIVGDFNVAYGDYDLERFSANRYNTMYTKEERRAFMDLLSLGLMDVYRVLHPHERKYTWWPYAFNARNRNIGWRIDYILITSKGIKVEDFEVCSHIYGSDHCPLRIVFQLKNI